MRLVKVLPAFIALGSAAPAAIGQPKSGIIKRLHPDEISYAGLVTRDLEERQNSYGGGAGGGAGGGVQASGSGDVGGNVNVGGLLQGLMAPVENLLGNLGFTVQNNVGNLLGALHMSTDCTVQEFLGALHGGAGGYGGGQGGVQSGAGAQAQLPSGVSLTDTIGRLLQALGQSAETSLGDL
jgi:hypothetical protein